ncbi:hypothetical protein [Peribacillus simplex]|uniref:Uncharacterized protein n=1 Tax=Peribacillus simplex TaxID=1478 RepID=A0A9W4L3Q5_9BACI|nr:hypothetical protein [Peribacillus simplex]CAH0289387.1 hypothetical protein SRABI133_04186 [Peribacillus simplex]
MEYQALSHARLQRLISFTILAQKITEPGRTKISNNLISELKDSRLFLMAALGDELIGKIAANKLLILDELIPYCNVVNEGNTQAARLHFEKAALIHEAGDRMMTAIYDGKEVDDIEF